MVYFIVQIINNNSAVPNEGMNVERMQCSWILNSLGYRSMLICILNFEKYNKCEYEREVLKQFVLLLLLLLDVDT